MKPMYTALLRFSISMSVLGAILLVACSVMTSRARVAEDESAFPVRVSANSRYLEDARGNRAVSVLPRLPVIHCWAALESTRTNAARTVARVTCMHSVGSAAIKRVKPPLLC